MKRDLLSILLVTGWIGFCADDVVWHDDTYEVGATETDPAPPAFSFAVSGDETSVSVSLRAEAAVADDRLEIFLSPSGTDSEYYRFAVGPSAADAAAWYYAEGGNIQPDPYGPAWTRDVRVSDGTLTGEVRIPLSAFYMTRNENWRETWRVNVVRRREGRAAMRSWSPLAASLHEPSVFRTLGGFPLRAEVDDACMSEVVAEMKGPQGGSVVGVLQLRVYAALAGSWELASSYGTAAKALTLKRGDNKVALACAYPDRGTYLTHFTLTHKGSGRVLERDWPVRVDYQPVSVVLTRPQYRASFYPGQDASVVSGTLSLATGGSATVTLTGPGFPERTATVADGGTFSFDTTGFEVGEATLTVTAGADTLVRKVRRLAPSARRMTWVEDGHLVVDGTPVFRRNMYAKDYMIGARMKARYAAEGDAFPMTTEMNQVELSPSRLISGIEDVEAKKDVRPCPELFAKIDERIAANANTDFGCYYICDEPECRSISPVYLKYIYDYVAEKDPYHVIDMATRAGPRYLDCADVLEAHPYLNPYWSEGQRCYGRRPSELGSYIDAFEPELHPEKCVGGLPTCFAGNGEYPTLDEYLLNCWVEIAHGAKTLWPYADHDIGDRAQLWEGTRYAFESARALTDIILFGTRTMFVNEEQLQGALFERGGDRLVILCNCSAEEQTADLVELAGISGTFREFRGTRTFDFQPNNRTITTLQPLESVVLVTGSPDAGLSTLADLRATVAAAEAERLGRDNQLLGRSSEIIVTHDLDGTRNSKLFDGCRDVLCKYRSWKSMNQLEMSFSGFVASFSKLRVFGMGLDSMTVKIRKGGEWVPLEPVAVRTEEWMRELDFGVTNETVKMRLEFPGPSGKKNDLELYEIELPRAGDAGGGGTVEPIPDAGVKALWDENDCPITNKYSTKCWYAQGSFPPIQVTDTGFCVTSQYSTSAKRYQASVSRYLERAKQGKWVVIDIDRFVKIPNQSYYSWSAMFLNRETLAGGVTSPQAGIYTIRMPAFTSGEFFRMDIYGFDVYFNSIGFMDEPANRVELIVPEGEDDVRPGVRIAVEVRFAVPCADVSAEFLHADPAGGYDAFKVNGSSGIDLKATDGSLTVWRAEIDVAKCSAANARSVYVKAVPLGGSQNRPVFGNFTVPFKSVPLADVVISSPGAQTLAAPNRYLMLSNAVASADVVFDRSSSAASASAALKFTGFDAVVNATTRFRGGWWDFMGLNGFFRADSANGGRLTEFSSGAVVTNAGPIEVAGTKGDGNALVLKGASSLFADSLVLGRKSSAGQRSRVLVSDGSLLSVAGKVSFSEKGLWTPKGLTGNELVVSNAGSRLVVGGTTYVGRQFTKAESGDKDGYDGTMGGNVLVVTDGARASLRQLTIDNSCRHGVSNRLEVSRGAYLETTGLGLGSGWSSVVRDDHHRIDVFDGGIVSNRGAFAMGEYENSNHKYLTLAVSNGTFVATGKIDATKSLIQAAESEIRISGQDAVFQVGSYSSATPLFGSYAYGSRVIVENGACVELPIAYSYGYTHKTVRNAVIFRNGARYNGGNVGMAGYGSGGKACYSNSFVVASGSVVTTSLFRANCIAGRVTVEDATLVSKYKDSGTSNHALWFGYPNDGTYSGGSNVVLEVKGRAPKVVAANGGIRFDRWSLLRIELPDRPYADGALPLVTAKDTLVFDAATDCGVEILGADAFLRGLRRAHVRFARCELVRAKSITISATALAEAARSLPKGLSLALETLVSGTQSLVLTADAASGCALILR